MCWSCCAACRKAGRMPMEADRQVNTKIYDGAAQDFRIGTASIIDAEDEVRNRVTLALAQVTYWLARCPGEEHDIP